MELDFWELQAIRAETLARAAHWGQRTKYDDTPYIEHVARVAAHVFTGLDRAVAWLHDVMEDTPFTREVLAAAGICDLVLDAVELLTRSGDHRNYEPYLHRLETAAKAGVHPASGAAVRVKISDLRDNLRPSCPPTLRLRYESALQRMWCLVRENAV